MAVTQNHEDAAPHGRLAHFPISFFAITMGLCGLALALLRFEHASGLQHSLSIGALVLAGLSAVTIAVFYLTKWLRYPAAVKAEWHHPVRLAFFPSASISLLLLGTAAMPFSRNVALTLWAAGAVLHLGATLAVLSAWIGHRPFDIPHLNPAWFIPAVGNIIVPVAGGPLGYAEVSWFFFAVGIVFWVILMTLVFNRLIFHNPLPERLLPTLVILIAPPAVGFIAYTRLIDGLDPFARILYYAAVLFGLLMLTQLPRFARIAFAISWWAYSFPIAALTVATYIYAEKTASTPHLYVAYGLTAVLGALIALLVSGTARAVIRGDICKPE